MTTRAGNAADFQAVVPMMRQHRFRRQQRDPDLDALHPDAEQRFRRWVGVMAQDPRSTLIVAEEGGRIIGFLYATIEQREPPIFLHEEYALVREWWVEPPLRRHGTGKALIEHAVAELAAIDITQIRVRTAAPDDELRSLLQHCGFRTGVCEMVMELRPRRKRAPARRKADATK